MKITNSILDEVKIFEPKVFHDERGFFFESFNKKFFQESINYEIEFVQDNHSKSSKGVLRGLHYQLDPFAQGKLVRVISGEVFDVAVDIRVNSKDFGKWFGVKLSADNKKQLWIPKGFAHGFLTLSDSAEFLYKTTNFYNKNSERSIIWNDPDINIDWGSDVAPIVSIKDKNAPFLKDADLFI
tara:strand:+ start:2376 stop:2924 length:549 start_codon:yes stop_codon:yes gene_type:complete